MSAQLERYAEVAGEEAVDQLRQLARPLKGMRVVHVNSTRVGGGVAEILTKLVPLKRELGIDATWEVIEGDAGFYGTTKSFHNALQGNRVTVGASELDHYRSVNLENAQKLRATLESADVVFIHDPQPAPLLEMCPNREGRWIWRCHIDVSRPYRPIWRFLKGFLQNYDASVFSLAAFSHRLPHPQYLIPPSIDPLSDKNRDLTSDEITSVYDEFGIDPDREMILQVSRFDRFKDPVGVIEAYRLARKFTPTLQLVLAGGSATDDPEGAAVLDETRRAANHDPDIHILLLPPDAHLTINALQRAADIVLQKSIREGFGLTVAEAMWKSRPVIGGDTGGIRLQVVNHQTGFLVSTPEGAALRIRYLLHHRDRLEQMGAQARAFVCDHFLLTRHLREYLTVMLALEHQLGDRIELA
ncbi:MAG: glycosyltransferase [Candidatus Eisenbacteria bacterium]|nr:glycosyltransferase [Candidatus Eisenbacteria bacterium]